MAFLEIDPEQLGRGLELLGITRDDMERRRTAPDVQAELWVLADLKLRAKAEARRIAREMHPDMIGEEAAARCADDLRAVLLAADWVRDLEPDPRRRQQIQVRVRKVDMGIRVEADAPHWTDR